MKFLLTAILVAFLVRNTQAQLRINELMASNNGAVTDLDGDAPDWIELYNAGSSAVNMDGYGLSDRKNQPFQWTFPGFQLRPGEYLLVFASGKDRRESPGYWNTIISKGDDWKYLVPKAEPTGNWRFNEFNDASWLTGRSGFGFGDDDDNTKIPDASCVFLRKKFSIANPAEIQQLILHMDFDDGFVAYLNGKEIARENMVGKGEFPAYSALASGQHEALIYQGLSPDKFIISNPAGILKSGENVLAIQVHNIFASSTDFSAIPFLSVNTSSQPSNSRNIAILNLTTNHLHTNFKLDADGESVYLTNPSGAIADSVRFGALTLNTSYGRSLKNPNSWMSFLNSTPGKENSSESYSTENPGIPEFSSPGGIYAAPLQVSLVPPTPKDSIYYTLDGSEPNRASYRYSTPININVSTVLRARVIKAGLLPGQVMTNSYILYGNNKMPLISISMNPADLWDYNTGIYVLGPKAESAQPNFGANFWMDWEKACHFEMMETTGNKVIDIDAGVKITGNWSRANAQKSMAFYFRKSYGEDHVNYKIFPERPFDEFKGLVLRNSGNDWNNTMFRDGLMTGLTLNLNINQQAFRPAVIYLNGAYWGILNIREKVNEDMLASQNNVDAGNVSILEFNGNIVEGTNTDYWTMINFLGTNSLAGQDNYNQMLKWIDVNSFIDYYSAEIYFRNHDWPGNNIKYWKTNDAAGRWRWILFDTDFGMGIWGSSPTENTLELATADNGPAWPNPPWSTLMFRRLLENQGFRNQFVNRFADLLNSNFRSDRVNRAIDRKRDNIADEIDNHLKKWNGGTKSNWLYNVQQMKVFASARPENVFSHIQQKFKFQNPEQITARADSTKGSIQFNSLTLTNFPWKGFYFSEVPVTLKAIPLAGYRFVKWTGTISDNTSASITLTAKAGLDVTAIFESDNSHYEDVVINEISFNNSGKLDPGDWIELFNKGKYDIDISGWKLTDSDPYHQFVFSPNTWLKANQFMVVSSDVSKLKAVFGTVKNLIEPQTFNFGLSNTIDAVKLYSVQNQLIDEVNYLNSEPWPTYSMDELWSLELIDPAKNNNSGRSWVLSAKYGTPGARNTINIPDEIQDLKTDKQTTELLQNYPNPFTDGTYLEFRLENPGAYRISILDVNGRLVRDFSEIRAISTVQNLYWDGNDSQGKPVSPGVYFYRLECKDYSEMKRMVKL